jgi:alpha-D-ribose 1-methylphosphonate 5-triphosphate diphosphatase
MSRPLRIVGGRVLADGCLAEADLLVADGRIVGLDGAGAAGALTLDARGLLVLPGLVDLHGDAFERQMQPRPGVNFAADIALADTELQLLGNGITTAYHGVTLSWEPGLRGMAAWRALSAALFARAWTCDMRLHLRWEALNLDALPVALADIAAGRVGLLAFNDHTPEILPRLDDPARAAGYAARSGVSVAELRAIGERAAARGGEVAESHAALAAAAKAAGIPMASHDDESQAMRDGFRALGARISEFPMSEPVARAARAAGDWVAMGSPNVVRGGSHMGWASAGALAEAGVCTVLTSDYFYPCLLRAPFVLAARGAMQFADSWALVSANPAAAAGMTDRGTIAPEKRADLVIVAATAGGPQVLATIAGGRVAHLAAAGAERLSQGGKA